jgi:hypothetical protein
MNRNQPIQLKGLLLQSFKGWIYLAVTCSFFFMSCARYYYAPNSVNIPLLEEKEAKINAQYLNGLLSDGFECQSAFAISSHFGGMVNMMVGGSKNEDYYLTEGKTNMSFIEAGAGYFTPIKSTALVFETYGGIGTGGIRNEYDPGNSTVRFSKLFIQPNIGVKVKGFEFGISSRMSRVKHNVISNDLDPSEYHADLDYLINNPVSFLWEPGVVLRAGGKKFMVQLQYTGSVNLTDPEYQFTREEGYFAIGFSIPIHYTMAGQ